MSAAFYSEAQIWPWVRGSEFVMFAINWTDREDFVCHQPHRECRKEAPHLMSTCGRFTGPREDLIR